MSNNKQSSSIDFFWNQLPEILPFTVDTETAVKLWGAFEQAKAMRKEEIIKVWIDAYTTNMKSPTRDNFILWAENYYNETFNNEQTN
jgi:hypothetical protein